MTDKERILMMIITTIIPSLSLGENNSIERLRNCELKHGDLVFTNTTIYPNKFMVGFVEEVKRDHIVIREIGSNNLCAYYNESFTKINKELLGYEILEGIEYKIYRKVLKAFEHTNYNTRFKAISFNEKICTVQARTVFKNDLLFEISFPYDKKTTIKDIYKILLSKEK